MFTLGARVGVNPSVSIVSRKAYQKNIGESVTVSITSGGGEYRVNGGGWMTAAGVISDGDYLEARLTSSSNYETTIDLVFAIGTGSDTFTVTTRAADIVCDAFSFTSVTDAEPTTSYTSNAITVSGIEIDVPVSIVGGMYSIDGGAFTATTGTVSNGQTVAVKRNSSASYEGVESCTLTVGTVTGEYSITNREADIIPDAFTFTAQTGVAPSTLIVSNTITVAGIEAAVAISVSNGEYQIGIEDWTSGPGTVINGDTVKVRNISSPNYEEAKNTTLTIGGVSDMFTYTTRGEIPTMCSTGLVSLWEESWVDADNNISDEVGGNDALIQCYTTDFTDTYAITNTAIYDVAKVRFKFKSSFIDNRMYLFYGQTLAGTEEFYMSSCHNAPGTNGFIRLGNSILLQWASAPWMDGEWHIAELVPGISGDGWVGAGTTLTIDGTPVTLTTDSDTSSERDLRQFKLSGSSSFRGAIPWMELYDSSGNLIEKWVLDRKSDGMSTYVYNVVSSNHMMLSGTPPLATMLSDDSYIARYGGYYDDPASGLATGQSIVPFGASTNDNIFNGPWDAPGEVFVFTAPGAAIDLIAADDANKLYDVAETPKPVDLGLLVSSATVRKGLGGLCVTSPAQVGSCLDQTNRYINHDEARTFFINVASVVTMSANNSVVGIMDIVNGESVAAMRFYDVTTSTWLDDIETAISLSYAYTGSTIRIAIISDLHIGLASPDPNAPFLAVIDAIDDTITGVDKVFVLGDIVGNTPKTGAYYGTETVNYKSLRATSDIADSNWHEIAGNHDLLTGADGFLAELLGSESALPYYTVDVGNIVFLMVSNDDAVSGDGYISDEANSWIATTLAANDDKICMVLTHHPRQGTTRYSSNSDYMYIKNADSLENGGYDAWFSGHTHAITGINTDFLRVFYGHPYGG